MTVFPSNPLRRSPLHRTLRKYPGLFGVPFLLIIVGASFGLQSFTQTRYDLQSQRITQMSKEQELGLDKDRKKFDIREEYFVSPFLCSPIFRFTLVHTASPLSLSPQKLSASGEDEWEPKRIARPKGLPEWGVPPEEPPQKPSATPPSST
ncbi:hypothetical protein EVG20_g7091 [Dentipellis fragilis]|uniref:Cytochrome c oxidase assembly protein COX16, mitochondrial n=1 Tax=Dentipellis fragilis TaxID=205917 RepID=A0A4Y9YGV8_9AGAM|nr:hypothetical protein EVG20_g7091 [Dentipellis fragilis]